MQVIPSTSTVARRAGQLRVVDAASRPSPLPLVVRGVCWGGVSCRTAVAAAPTTRSPMLLRATASKDVAAAANAEPGRAIASKKEVGRDGLLKAAALSVATAIGGAVIAMNIDKYSDVPCTVSGTCAQISDIMKALLVGTHLYTFLLVPATMYVFYTSLRLRERRIRSPFTALMGLSLISVAIMGEIGWHIEQAWFYKEEYNVLNLSFYFFLNSGLAAWALGLRLDEPRTGPGSDALTAASPFIAQELQLARLQLQAQLNAAAAEAAPAPRQGLTVPGFNLGDAADYFLLSVPALTLFLYYLGASATDTKVPIYAMMSAVFTVLTWRFWKLLKTKWVLSFPLFSVGVNLGFIFLLDKYQTDAFLNPLFHILHDAAGTQLGVAIIAGLTYTSLADDGSE